MLNRTNCGEALGFLLLLLLVLVLGRSPARARSIADRGRAAFSHVIDIAGDYQHFFLFPLAAQVIFQALKKAIIIGVLVSEHTENYNTIPEGGFSNSPETFVLLWKVSQTTKLLDQSALQDLESVIRERFSAIVMEGNINFVFLH
jgi:hypothetical protein